MNENRIGFCPKNVFMVKEITLGTFMMKKIIFFLTHILSSANNEEYGNFPNFILSRISVVSFVSGVLGTRGTS